MLAPISGIQIVLKISFRFSGCHVVFCFLFLQAECEELQRRVEALSGENHSLKDELQRLSEECEKLTSENSSIKVLNTFLSVPLIAHHPLYLVALIFK